MTVKVFGEVLKDCVIVDLDEKVKDPQESSQSQIDDELATTAHGKNIKIKRKDMTPEHKREYMRIKKIESKNKESEKASTKQRESERITNASKRKAESEEEATMRLVSDRIAKAARRKLETEEEESQRQESDRIAKATRRKLETEEETSQRQESGRIAEATRRKLETGRNRTEKPKLQQRQCLEACMLHKMHRKYCMENKLCPKSKIIKKLILKE